MNPYIYILSSLVGGLIAILGVYINNKFQLQKSKQEWQRSQTWKAYQKSIECLLFIENILKVYDQKGDFQYQINPDNRDKIYEKFASINPYIKWIVNGYENKTLKEYKTIQQEIDNWDDVRLIGNPESFPIIRKYLYQLMKHDSRII